MIGVTLWEYWPLSLLGSSLQPQIFQILCLGYDRPAIATFTIYNMVVSMIDITIWSIYSSSPGQCQKSSWELFSHILFLAMSESAKMMVNLNTSTSDSDETLQCRLISNVLWPEVSSLLCSVSTHHYTEQKNHQGNEIHTNVHQYTLRSRGFFGPHPPSVKDNLRPSSQVLPSVSNHRGWSCPPWTVSEVAFETPDCWVK